MNNIACVWLFLPKREYIRAKKNWSAQCLCIDCVAASSAFMQSIFWCVFLPSNNNWSGMCVHCYAIGDVIERIFEFFSTFLQIGFSIESDLWWWLLNNQWLSIALHPKYSTVLMLSRPTHFVRFKWFFECISLTFRSEELALHCYSCHCKYLIAINWFFAHRKHSIV